MWATRRWEKFASDADGWNWRRGKNGGASGLRPTLRKGAKDGAPEPLGLVKGRPPPKCVNGWGTRPRRVG
jgi:hypothetical protein